MIWIVTDTIFAVIFSVELFLRASKGLREFLTDKDQKLWNWFDAFLVVTALLELLVARRPFGLCEFRVDDGIGQRVGPAPGDQNRGAIDEDADSFNVIMS